MEWIQQLDRYEPLSNLPLSQKEIMALTKEDNPDDPKCNIVFP